jgi:Flp pilus assembly pilin Flp
MRGLSNAARYAYAWPEARSDQGVTAIQYAALLIFVGVVTIIAVTLVVQNLPDVFNAVAAKVTAPS